AVFSSSPPMPSRKRIKQVPTSSKPRGEVADGRWCVQLVQCEVCSRKALLPQLAAEHVHGVITPSRCFRQTQVRHKEGTRLTNFGRGSFCVSYRRFAQGI